jgi:hypothetical protein
MSESMWPDGLRLVAMREHRRDSDVAARLSDLAALIGDWMGCGPLNLAGKELRRIDLTPAGITTYLDALRTARAGGDIQVFSLGSGADADESIILYDWNDLSPIPIEQMWLPLELPDAHATIELVARVAAIFSAITAFTEDPRIVRLTRARRAIERALARIPDERRHDASPPALPPVVANMPQLLVPEEYDRRRAPEGVYWVNVWSAPIVETVGEQRVREAPWAEVRELDQGALLLVATRHVLDPTSAKDIGILAAILRELDLRSAQERWRLAE